MYKVYILLCSDNSFYIGYTANLKKRLHQHHSNTQESFYLKSKLPVKLVYYENHETEIEAIRKERQLKGWSRAKKINLVKNGYKNSR